MIHSLICGALTCDLLGFSQAGIREKLRRAAWRFNVIDYMRFDPVHESPPNNIPLLCKTSDRSAPRGAETLTSYSSAEVYYNAYDMMTDALIRGYFGESYGIKMGRYLNEIVLQLDALRPYPTFTCCDGDSTFVSSITSPMSSMCSTAMASIAWLPQCC